jgi:enoyl-CoA hydratase
MLRSVVPVVNLDAPPAEEHEDVSDLSVSPTAHGVVVVTLDRPRARNALSRALRDELQERLGALDADPDVRAIVLTGSDPAFCSGMDVKEIAADPASARTIGPRRAPVIDLRTPLIGAVNGPALTGGLELALACDWLIASEHAAFGDSHARLGLTPGWGLTVLLAEAVGTGRARRMITTSEVIDARTAWDWGLVTEVVPHEELLPRALEQAAAVAEGDPRAVRTVLATFAEQRSIVDAPAWAIEARHWIDPAGIASDRSNRDES